MRFGAPGYIHVEQMNLVVARCPLPIGLVDQAGGRHASVGVLAQWHGTADDPYLEAPGRVCKEVLDASGTVRLRDDPLVAAVTSHEGEVLGEGRENRTETCRLREKTPGRLEIGIDVVAGGHLDCRYAHAANLKQMRLQGAGSQVPCHWTRRASGASVQPRRATDPRSAVSARASRARAGVGTALAASDTRS